MADTLSIASSIISLVRGIDETYQSLSSKEENLKNFSVCKTYVAALNDVAEWLPSSSHAVSDSIVFALRDCHDSISTVQGAIGKKKGKLEFIEGHNKGKIERDLQKFIEHARAMFDILNFHAVRQISMDLRSLRDSNLSFNDEQRSLASLSHLVKDITLELHNLHDSDSKIQRQELSGIVQRLDDIATNTPTYSESEFFISMKGQGCSKHNDSQRRDNDSFTFTAKIIHRHDSERDYTAVRALLGTGCPVNCISREVVERAGMQRYVESMQEEQTFVAFGGKLVRVSEKISITWYNVSSSMSRKTEFNIHDRGPFDMVFGKGFITAENLLVLNEPILSLRHANISKEDFMNLERDARDQKDARNQLDS